MKITIDTQQDSYEDINKILHILTGILEKKGQSSSSGYQHSLYSSSPSSSQTATDTTNLMSMFDDASSTGTTTNKSEAKDSAPDFSSFLNLTKPIEKKEAVPRVEIF